MNYNILKQVHLYLKGGNNMLIAKSNEIKKRRLQKKLSKSKLSLNAGLPANAICRIESNKHSYIYPIRAKAIANALDCKVEDIFDKQ